MNTWSEIIKRLSPEQIRELEKEALDSPILYALRSRSYATTEEPVIVEVSQGNPLCSCVKTARKYVPDLPRQNAEDFIPNTYPFAGAIAIYDYGKYKHIGFVESLEEKGFWELGGNIEPCEPYRRFVEWGDVYLTGFYKSDLFSLHKLQKLSKRLPYLLLQTMCI